MPPVDAATPCVIRTATLGMGDRSHRQKWCECRPTLLPQHQQQGAEAIKNHGQANGECKQEQQSSVHSGGLLDP